MAEGEGSVSLFFFFMKEVGGGCTSGWCSFMQTLLAKKTRKKYPD